jgi:cytochrome c oxidase cbb3-type subunit I/II
MPPYPWLVENTIDAKIIPAKIKAMRNLGVPYPDGYEFDAGKDMEIQAKSITSSLKTAGISVKADKEIVALIAYLQRLGTDIKVKAADGSTISEDSQNQ